MLRREAREDSEPRPDRRAGLPLHRCAFARLHLHADAARASDRRLLLAAAARIEHRARRCSAVAFPPGTPTIASLLKQAGYRTGVVGKWHIGLGPEGGPDWNGEINPGPLEIGFDYAFLMAATGDRVPTVYVENHRVVGLDPGDPIHVSYKSKVGDEPTGAENPELLKLKHTHGHDMTIVNGVGRIGWMTGGKAARWNDEDMADTFAGKAIVHRAAAGRAVLPLPRHAQHPRAARPASAVSREQPGRHARRLHPRTRRFRRPGAGRRSIELKLTDKTLVIFTSDNGGVMDDGYEDVGSFDYNPNAPLNGTKGTLYEGGHRVPFIARWPGKIQPATTSDTLMAHLDMAATFAALTGTPLEAAADSFNVLPALLGEPTHAAAALRRSHRRHARNLCAPQRIVEIDRVAALSQQQRAMQKREMQKLASAGAIGFWSLRHCFHLAMTCLSNTTSRMPLPKSLLNYSNSLQRSGRARKPAAEINKPTHGQDFSQTRKGPPSHEDHSLVRLDRCSGCQSRQPRMFRRFPRSRSRSKRSPLFADDFAAECSPLWHRVVPTFAFKGGAARDANWRQDDPRGRRQTRRRRGCRPSTVSKCQRPIAKVQHFSCFRGRGVLIRRRIRRPPVHWCRLRPYRRAKCG